MKGEQLDRPVGGRQWMGGREQHKTRGGRAVAPAPLRHGAELIKMGGAGWHGFVGKNGVGWAHR